MLQICSRFFHHVFTDRRWLAALILANVVGFLWGIVFYWQQLMATPPLLWIFVLDSPLAVLFAAVVCALRVRKKRVPGTLAVLAIIGLIKYGLWTALVLVMHWSAFFGSSPLIATLNLPLHVAMIIEGIALLAAAQFRKRDIIVPLVFFVVNDGLDYFANTLTAVRPTVPLAAEAFASTLILALVLFFASSRSHSASTARSDATSA